MEWYRESWQGELEERGTDAIHASLLHCVELGHSARAEIVREYAIFCTVSDRVTPCTWLLGHVTLHTWRPSNILTALLHYLCKRKAPLRRPGPCAR